jgi:hypothetical protein
MACVSDSTPRARASHHVSVRSWSAIIPRSASTAASVRSSNRSPSTKIALKTSGKARSTGTPLVRQRFDHRQFRCCAAVHGGKASGRVKPCPRLHAADTGQHIPSGRPFRRRRPVDRAGPRTDARSSKLHRVHYLGILGMFIYVQKGGRQTVSWDSRKVSCWAISGSFLTSASTVRTACKTVV